MTTQVFFPKFSKNRTIHYLFEEYTDYGSIEFKDKLLKAFSLNSDELIEGVLPGTLIIEANTRNQKHFKINYSSSNVHDRKLITMTITDITLPSRQERKIKYLEEKSRRLLTGIFLREEFNRFKFKTDRILGGINQAIEKNDTLEDHLKTIKSLKDEFLMFSFTGCSLITDELIINILKNERRAIVKNIYSRLLILYNHCLHDVEHNANNNNYKSPISLIANFAREMSIHLEKPIKIHHPDEDLKVDNENLKKLTHYFILILEHIMLFEIEDSKERKMLKKNEIASIYVSSEYKNDQYLIEISHDGQLKEDAFTYHDLTKLAQAHQADLATNFHKNLIIHSIYIKEENLEERAA